MSEIEDDGRDEVDQDDGYPPFRIASALVNGVWVCVSPDMHLCTACGRPVSEDDATDTLDGGSVCEECGRAAR